MKSIYPDKGYVKGFVKKNEETVDKYIGKSGDMRPEKKHKQIDESTK